MDAAYTAAAAAVLVSMLLKLQQLSLSFKNSLV